METIAQQNMSIEKKIYKLSKMYNYFDSKKAIKLLTNMTLEEAKIVLLNSKVQETIFKIDDVNTLKEIFRKSPAFFQEIMFSNENIQDLLISPKKSLKRKELINNYNNKNFVFNENEIRSLEVFLSTIKSPKIYEQIIESKFFQRLVPLFSESQIKRTFFKNMDVVKLFYNIINDDEIFKTQKYRRQNVINVFNKVSNHILLPDDYESIINNGQTFIRHKIWAHRDAENIYIDEKTLSLLTTPMLQELLEANNVDTNNITNFLKKDVIPKIKRNNYDFKKIFPQLLLGNNYNNFNGIDYIYFNIIIEEISNNEFLKEKFITFIYNTLCAHQNFDISEQNMIKQVLYNKMKNNNITKEDYRKLFYYPDALKTVFYLKFGNTASRMDYLNGISVKQLIYLNIKHINQILNALNIENEDELSNLYSCAIKMYLVFGLERTLKILNNDYGKINRYFFDNVSKLNVKNIEFLKEGKKYIPKISNEFIKFMFASQNDNHFINMLAFPTSLLNKNWSYLYNNYDAIKDKCHGTLTLKKINIILKELSNERDLGDVTPNNYKLKENDILNDICLGNKTKYSNNEIYKSVLDIYEKMKCRTESSIPYVKGEVANGYYYEMMKLNDPIAFTLGYKINCCIRVNDIAHNHLLHATLCKNGRILLIYNQFHEIAGFIPLKRNGEVLIANSVECLHKIKNKNTIIAFEEAIKDIVNTSQKEEKEPINLVCIGNEAYAKPDGVPFPSEIPTPTIYEKNESTYSNTDQYHRKLDIIYKKPSLDLSNIKYGDPKCTYTDPRPIINSCDFRNSNIDNIENALKIINAVRYENEDIEKLENFKLYEKHGIDKCIYSEDWYIFTTYDGNIYGDFMKFNPKAEIEYKIAFSELVGMNYNDYKEKHAKEKKLEL